MIGQAVALVAFFVGGSVAVGTIFDSLVTAANRGAFRF